MKNSRRKFLKTLAAGVIGGEVMTSLPGNVFAKKDPSNGGFEIQKGFKVFNEDTQKNMLKMAEAIVPGSKEMGIQEKVMNLVRNDKGVAGFLDAGLWNIESLSRAVFDKPFHALDNKEDINRILKHVSVRNRSFFRMFKGIVMKFYYTDPTVWKKLSYQGPPQPRGFMDYSEPPEKTGKIKVK